MPVNRPHSPIPPGALPSAGAEGRLYLRDQDLNEGAAAIRAAARKLTELVVSASQASGLSAPELEILEEIFDRGPMDVGVLRTRLASPKQSLARNLNHLEERGFVTRAADSRDRRRRLVQLTEAGASLTRDATERRRSALRQAFIAAGPDAVTGARRVLSDLVRTRGDT